MNIPRDPIMTDEQLEELYALKPQTEDEHTGLWLAASFGAVLIFTLGFYALAIYSIYRVVRGIFG